MLPLLSSFFHHDNHKINSLAIPFIFLKLQWGLHDDRSILGHQSRPAWVIHAFLAPQPRRGRQHGERREPPVRVHHTHRLPTQVLHQNLSVLSIYQVSFFVFFFFFLHQQNESQMTWLVKHLMLHIMQQHRNPFDVRNLPKHYKTHSDRSRLEKRSFLLSACPPPFPPSL